MGDLSGTTLLWEGSVLLSHTQIPRGLRPASYAMYVANTRLLDATDITMQTVCGLFKKTCLKRQPNAMEMPRPFGSDFKHKDNFWAKICMRAISSNQRLRKSMIAKVMVAPGNKFCH